MRIEQMPWGKRVFIRNNDVYDTYEFREVRPLNEWHVRLHPSIVDLEAQEKKLIRKLLILLFQLENCLSSIYKEPPGRFIEMWETHNRLSFNEWFNDGIRDLIDRIDGISEQYCINASEDGYGWSF